jgi:predicted negative regulator of RcsB-dependent stress response
VKVFLKKLFGFNKDYRYHLEKGDRYLQEERYADARDAFAEAMQKLAESDVGDVPIGSLLREKFTETGNRLGELNLTEAEHALNNGDQRKAEEHLRIVTDLAEDVALREKAEKKLAGLVSHGSGLKIHDAHYSCSSCKDDSSQEIHDIHAIDDQLAAEDRFALYVQTLPGDLVERYAAMGERFAQGCLLNLDGDGEGALKLFAELSGEARNDILDYEIAIIYYRKGDLKNCEMLLRRAIELNSLNPLCHLGIVQLLAETGRVAEAFPFLEQMINADLLPDQARLLLGDAYLVLEDKISAIESYSQVLTSPKYAKEAAEKLIPLLEMEGRKAEAAYLVKKFMKGCC